MAERRALEQRLRSPPRRIREISMSGIPEVCGLTRRERQVVSHIVLGHSRAMAAEIMAISVRTYDSMRWNACRKLGIASDVEFVRLAFEAGWCELEPLRTHG